MLNSVVLETAIGLVFVYLLLSLVCTAVNEWIAHFAGLRAQTLRKAIDVMLAGKAGEFYAHPLVKALNEDARGPGYIPSGTFATTVRGILTGNKVQNTVDDLRAAVDGLPDGDLKKSLQAVLQDGTLTLELAQARLESWFNQVMDRVSGWYKRKLRLITLCVAAAVTIVLNVDTLRIAGHLAEDTDLRLRLVAAAEQRVAQGTPPAAPGAEERDYLRKLGGWRSEDFSSTATLWRIPGWILTILAVSLGAPFWFDVLNRVVAIRSGGKAPAEAK